MALLVGIDEAGFGPLLGPLVVSSSVFSLPSHLAEADLWQVLRRSVSDRRKGLAGRLLVADSKKAYSRRGGVKSLERTVLAVLACLGKEPAAVVELMEILCPDCLERLSGYPWYRSVRDLRIAEDRADSRIAGAVLGAEMASNGINLLDLKSRCLDVGYYNRMMSSVRNKASVLFWVITQLMQAVFDNNSECDIRMVVDRQGGRVRYRESLQRSFPDMDLRVVHEGPKGSRYELRTKSRVVGVDFVVNADALFLPVSLASMVSKYLREVLMCCINDYFRGLHVDLRPTAGYWKDGLRFIKDLRTNLPDVQIDDAQLIRCR